MMESERVDYIDGGQLHDESTDGLLRGRKIAVVGMGYVGVPTALSFTDRGAHVIGFDISEARLSAVKAGRIDMLARDVPRLSHAVQNSLLRLTTEASAVAQCDFVVICVPTPVDHHMTPDLVPLAAACETVVKFVRPGQTIVLTSTTYAGCTRDLLTKPLQNAGFSVGKDVFVAFSPERIDPGVAHHAPERTPRVVGGHTPGCSQRAATYLAHTAGELHFVSSPEAAELAKLLENTFRAVNIALANEFSVAAREIDVDIMEVINAAATKPYGFMPFYPGPGVGGHCIPCDPHYLLWQLRARRMTSPVVEAAMTAIAARPRTIVSRAESLLGGRGRPCRGARVLVLGVSYKAGLGDVRESPALAIMEMLSECGAHVAYSDPFVDTVGTATQHPLFSIVQPEKEEWDLIIVHTLHPTVDYTWLAGQPIVLDATYRLGLPNSVVP